MAVPQRLTRRWRPGRRVELGLQLGHLIKGPRDPTHRVLGVGSGRRFLRATRTPSGPALLSIVASSDEVVAHGWGEGADWALDRLPRLLGADDELDGFRPLPRHEALVAAHRARPHLRVGATDLVWESLSAAFLEQVVTGLEAYAAFRILVRRFGEPAPGPARDRTSPAWGMYVQPTPRQWATIPSWTFLAAGVEQRRSRPLVTAAGRASALERTLQLPPSEVDAALRSLPGIGHWTSAEVRQRAHGDADAWSIGDYHIPGNITFALVGEKLDDAACLEVLEPYRGHRFRVQQLLAGHAAAPPRRAPRMTLPTHTPRATHGRS